MKQRLRILLITLSLYVASCKNDFNINGPVEDVYMFNCILRNDTSVQYALISKNYFTDNGTVPAPNSIEQNIKGFIIKIYTNDSVFVMRDTTIQVAYSGNINQVNCYYVKNLIMNPGQVIRIEAAGPDGNILKSTIQVPQISYVNFSPNFPQIYRPADPKEFLPGYQTKPYYSWNWVGATEESTTILSLPQLEVYYKKYDAGTLVDKKVLIPLVLYYIIDKDGNVIPVQVDLSFNRSCITSLEAVNKVMQDISGNDPYKENYIITKVVFSVISLDPVLTKYYSANNTYSESFTVKLRQTDFSNIEGGKGLFGIYYKFANPLVVDSFYVKSFGYRYAPS